MVVTFLVRWSRFLDGSGSIAPVWNEDKEDDNDDEGLAFAAFLFFLKQLV